MSLLFLVVTVQWKRRGQEARSLTRFLEKGEGICIMGICISSNLLWMQTPSPLSKKPVKERVSCSRRFHCTVAPLAKLSTIPTRIDRVHSMCSGLPTGYCLALFRYRQGMDSSTSDTGVCSKLVARRSRKGASRGDKLSPGDENYVNVMATRERAHAGMISVSCSAAFLSAVVAYCSPLGAS